MGVIEAAAATTEEAVTTVGTLPIAVPATTTVDMEAITVRATIEAIIMVATTEATEVA